LPLSLYTLPSIACVNAAQEPQAAPTLLLNP